MTTEQNRIPTQPTRARATGVSAYFELAQRQLETNLKVAATWASAFSAMSGSMLAPAQSGGRTSGDEPAPGIHPASSGQDRAFRLIGGTGFNERPSTGYWTAAGSTTSWPRWLNEEPTLQPDLFDEAIELLVDDDIKTAS